MDNLQQPNSVPSVMHEINKVSINALICDLSFVLSSSGVVLTSQINDLSLAELVTDSWLNQNLVDLVIEDSVDAVKTLLNAANTVGAQVSEDVEEVVWDDISIQLPDDTVLPLRLGLLAQSTEENYLAIGRDMRVIAGLRQQLLNAQLTVEQDYWRLRMVETRYRSLFQMVADALIIVDDDTGKVLESNPAGNKLLMGDGTKLVGKTFPRGFDPKTTKRVESFIDRTRVSGRGELEDVEIQGSGQTVTISASMLRQAEEARLLLRIFSQTGLSYSANNAANPTLDAHLLDAPDAIVLTDPDGRVVSTNDAFVALSELRNVDQAVGRNISSWIGKTSVESNVLISNLKRHRTVKLFATQIRGEFDSVSEVEISAYQTAVNETDCFLFIIRDVSRRLSGESPESAKLPSSVAQITDQVGRTPLKDLVKQSTSVIEKLCIESALSITNNNRASAAELLGLSRQSLYAKLRLYGLGDLAK